MGVRLLSERTRSKARRGATVNTMEKAMSSLTHPPSASNGSPEIHSRVAATDAGTTGTSSDGRGLPEADGPRA